MTVEELRASTGLEVVSLIGCDVSDPRRIGAYGEEPRGRKLFDPLTFTHRLYTTWHFDASDWGNTARLAEALEQLNELVCQAIDDTGHPYTPWRIVLDNFAGTLVGKLATVPA